MRADICDAEDKEALMRFGNVLKSIGAVTIRQDWAMGVDMYELRVGDSHLTVFSDAWYIDMEGPPDIVKQIVNAMNA